ncbi:DUF397 domain-containing protein [Nocardia jinanensis]|uniref:DUF397 domain-containing protein n=1 Tax=Nocardia jinanensis TaxID=382504 RepID=A0A917RUX2_9NOCA|nr:DUF397 domain-containing protein [Nocardia jinanensis]GGL35252.1 DUF397 domain-containing protein [Nocardia jinanensis]
MTVELSGAYWFKSSHSGASNECVEVAWLDGGRVGVRDSKNPVGPALLFTSDDWKFFTAALRDNKF